MKAEDIERIFKETVSRPENNIHLPFEKHARVGRKYNGEYIYSDKLICEYTPEQVLQQLQEIADEKKVDITESDVLIEQGRRYGGYDDEIFVKIIHPLYFPKEHYYVEWNYTLGGHVAKPIKEGGSLSKAVAYIQNHIGKEVDVKGRISMLVGYNRKTGNAIVSYLNENCGWHRIDKEDVIMVNSPLNRSYQYVSIEKLKHSLGPTRYKLNETITVNIKSEGENEEYKVKTSITYRDNDNNKERVVYETENTDDSFILNHTRRYENNDSCPLLDRFIFSAHQRYLIQYVVENSKKESKNDTEDNRLPLSEEGYKDL
jgi:hypothetical protein|nr:MAG TPA: hypothetical protein [Caudoviricetes sp.]